MSEVYRPYFFVIFSLGLLYSSNVSAETHYFSCVGVTTGEGISDSPHKFDIEINTNPPYLIGPVGPLGSCLLTIDKELQKKIDHTCKVSPNEMVCTCNGGDFYVSSTHRFSRLSGRLTFISVEGKRPGRKSSYQQGDYQCSKINKKLF